MKSGDPHVVLTPSTSTRSLIDNGIPCRYGFSDSGFDSISFACDIALSGHTVGIAFIIGSTSLILSRLISTNSVGFTSLLISLFLISVAEFFISSCIFNPL